jgi:hypothetical protein
MGNGVQNNFGVMKDVVVRGSLTDRPSSKRTRAFIAIWAHICISSSGEHLGSFLHADVGFFRALLSIGSVLPQSDPWTPLLSVRYRIIDPSRENKIGWCTVPPEDPVWGGVRGVGAQQVRSPAQALDTTIPTGTICPLELIANKVPTYLS